MTACTNPLAVHLLPHRSLSPPISLSRARSFCMGSRSSSPHLDNRRIIKNELKARKGPRKGGYLKDSQLLCAEGKASAAATEEKKGGGGRKRKRRRKRARKGVDFYKTPAADLGGRRRVRPPLPLVGLVLIRIAILSQRRRRINRVSVSCILVRMKEEEGGEKDEERKADFFLSSVCSPRTTRKIQLHQYSSCYKSISLLEGIVDIHERVHRGGGGGGGREGRRRKRGRR
jgi:hypothetical protein